MNNIIITRCRKMEGELDIRAYFDIIINGISIHGLKLIRSKKNIGQLYLGFPSEKDKDGKYHPVVNIEDVILKEEVFNKLVEIYNKEDKNG